MKSFTKRVFASREGLLLLLVVIVLTLSLITRIVLLARAWPQTDTSLLSLLEIFLLGLLFDTINAFYFSIPLILYLWLTSQKQYNRKWHGNLRVAIFFILTFILVFNATAEWLFWDEFNVRFNFIAIDYLVYTNQVVGNITQSYPITWIIIAVVLFTSTITFSLRHVIVQPSTPYWCFKTRSYFVLGYASFFVALLFGVSSKYHRFSKNAYDNELAGNGMYELFAAYLNNELDYEQFYSCLDDTSVSKLARKLLKTTDSHFTSLDPHSIERQISNSGPELKMNVVLISVESFSADFMRTFGNTENITPFLDSLSSQSLVFTNLYATGTRTVRGLEALSLCVPPTPGQSIVRRPDNEGLFSLGKVFKEKGYKTEYIYGGYSYFDNMGYFFGNNDYDVVDRSELTDDEIAYENVWGVADENLFDMTIKQLDLQTKTSPVFAHVMTTSNHRPFTYPEGRIDIPSHTNRQGAVKYTDYSIGRFIKQVAHKPWFKNTVFVIVADHCASSAGKTELPIDKYHIPMLIYAPGFVKSGVMTRLMSQIDIGPTLLGMLRFSYKSKFYGYDMFQLEAGRERAFISTYQSLGYLKNNKLIILSPQQKVQSMLYVRQSTNATGVKDQVMINEAIAWYQSASYSFKHKLMR